MAVIRTYQDGRYAWRCEDCRRPRLEMPHRGPRKSVCKACQNKRYRVRGGEILRELNRDRCPRPTEQAPETATGPGPPAGPGQFLGAPPPPPASGEEQGGLLRCAALLTTARALAQSSSRGKTPGHGICHRSGRLARLPCLRRLRARTLHRHSRRPPLRIGRLLFVRDAFRRVELTAHPRVLGTRLLHCRPGRTLHPAPPGRGAQVSFDGLCQKPQESSSSL